MSLQEQGFRLMANKETEDARWVHPAEVSALVGYTDCTDMDDAEFAEFVYSK